MTVSRSRPWWTRTLVLGAGAGVLLGGCFGESRDVDRATFAIEVLPQDQEVEQQYVLHVGEADVEALGLADGDIPDRYGDFALRSTIEVRSMRSVEHCLEEDATITRSGTEVGVVPAGSCMRTGARREAIEVRVQA